MTATTTLRLRSVLCRLRDALRGGAWVWLSALLTLASCQHIDESERFLFSPLESSSRAVLIEDFTGQRCINCPNAAEEIERLKQQYGADTIIAVGIHAGPLAVYSRGSVLGLRTEEGDAYYDYWKVEQEPTGLINRKGSLSTIDQWPTLVRDAVQTPSELFFTLHATHGTGDSHIKIYLNILNNNPVDGHIQLWLTESNIKALQMMPDGTANPDYIHNHVFRRTINGLWGEPYQSAQGEMHDLEYECALDPAWKTENLSVVAFFYDSRGVQCVAEAYVQEHDPFED